MFWRKDSSYHWTADYYDMVYKIYDKNRNLVAYFFPNYPKPPNNKEDESEFVDNLIQSHAKVNGGGILLPLIKLNLLDIEEGMNLENIIEQLESNTLQVKKWKEWFISHNDHKIIGSRVYTAREDREMLSILINLDVEFNLDKNQIVGLLTPILNDLSVKSLI